jgi:predicted N-acetyltransferase YhbS
MLSIRDETPADQEAVFHINSLAFERQDEARLVDALLDPYFFVLVLSPGALENCSGSVAYHPLFDGV